MGNMTHLLDENISGSDLVKIYHAQKNEESKFSQITKTIRQQRFKVDVAGGVNTSIVNVLIGLCLASVVFLSSTYLVMSAGGFLAFFGDLLISFHKREKGIKEKKVLGAALDVLEFEKNSFEKLSESLIFSKNAPMDPTTK